MQSSCSTSERGIHLNTAQFMNQPALPNMINLKLLPVFMALPSSRAFWEFELWFEGLDIAGLAEHLVHLILMCFFLDDEFSRIFLQQY